MTEKATNVPMTAQLALEFLSYLRVRVDTDPGDANVLALQGAMPLIGGGTPTLALVENVFDFYNDTIVVVSRSEEGDWSCEAYRGTVDPGLAYQGSPGGEAHLTFGQHLYRPGLHRGQPALRALNEINRVWRDRDQNTVYTPGDVLDVGKFGVNIHPGGKGERVGEWSAGCINVWGGWDGEPWKRFMARVAPHFKRKGSLGVTVWSAKDYAAAWHSEWTVRPTLRFGIANPWVAELQRHLFQKRHYPGPIDGDWRDSTETAVRAFQTARGLTPDGVVGAVTWANLTA